MKQKYIFDASTEGKAISPIIHWFRIIFLIGIWLFIACLLLQVFMAGMAVFIRPSWWAMHASFASIIGFLGFFLLAISFLGGFPKTIRAFAGLIVLLMFVQYTTIHLRYVPNFSLIGAFHAVNAFLLFWVAMTTGLKTKHFLKHEINPL
jgi:Family of unknown function (DUF6220)